MTFKIIIVILLSIIIGFCFSSGLFGLYYIFSFLHGTQNKLEIQSLLFLFLLSSIIWFLIEGKNFILDDSIEELINRIRRK